MNAILADISMSEIGQQQSITSKANTVSNRLSYY